MLLVLAWVTNVLTSPNLYIEFSREYWYRALVQGTGTGHWYRALVQGTSTGYRVLGTGTGYWYRVLVGVSLESSWSLLRVSWVSAWSLQGV